MKLEDFANLRIYTPDDLPRWEWLDADLIKRLDTLTYNLGLRKPMRILSSFRTQDENEIAGGAKASMHLLGKAVDLVAPGDPLTTYHEAEKVGFNGIGLTLNNNGVVSIHLDNRPGAPARWSKLYGAAYGALSDVVDRLKLLGYGAANRPAVTGATLLLTGLIIWYIFKPR